MRNQIIILLLLLIGGGVTVGCKKGTLLKGSFNGDIQVELLALPGTPTMDIYFDGVFIDTLAPGPGTVKYLLPADKKGVFAVKIKGTDSLVLDSTFTIPREQTFSLRMAYSEELNLKTFIGTSRISEDSVRVQFYNRLNDVIMPGNPVVEAELFYETPFNSGNFVPYDVPLLVPFDKNKLYPAVFTLPVMHPNGDRINYMIQCRDGVTKAPFVDQRNAIGASSSLEFYRGQNIVLFVQQRYGFGRYLFSHEIVAL